MGLTKIEEPMKTENSQATIYYSVGLAVQLCKCATWFSLGLFSRFLSELGFYAPSKGIRVLGVTLGSISFILFFPRMFGQ
jgi:hypothetical protein